MTDLDPNLVTKFIGSIYYIAKNGTEIKVTAPVFTALSEAYAIDTTDDRASGGPEFEIPLGSKWVRLPYKSHGQAVWERVN